MADLTKAQPKVSDERLQRLCYVYQPPIDPKVNYTRVPTDELRSILAELLAFRALRTRLPATDEAAARALCIVKGINPDAAHYGTSDRDVQDGTFPDGKPFYFGWRNQVKYVESVADTLLSALNDEGKGR